MGLGKLKQPKKIVAVPPEVLELDVLSPEVGFQVELKGASASNRVRPSLIRVRSAMDLWTACK